jgi:hypothetical protein
MALTPVTGVKGYNGKPLRGSGTVAGNHRALAFIRLLHKAGGLTLDQLRFLTQFSRPLGPTAAHETQDTIKLLRAIGFVEAIEQKGWNNSPTNIYILTPEGEVYQSLLPPSSEMYQAQDHRELFQRADLGYLYNKYQVLASIAGACGSSNVYLQIYLQNEVESDYDPTERRLLQLEWDSTTTLTLNYAEELRSQGTLLQVNSSVEMTQAKEEVRLQPTALGTVVLEDPALSDLLMNQSMEEVPVEQHSRLKPWCSYIDGGNESTTAHWNFVLELDDGIQSMEALATKVEYYSHLRHPLNQKYWPREWRGVFPSLLFVTTGDCIRLLKLMLVLADRLKKAEAALNPSLGVVLPDLLDGCWCTCTDWFKAAYIDYLGTFNKKEGGFYLGTRIWLPLRTVQTGLVEFDSPAKMMSAIRELNQDLVVTKGKGAAADKEILNGKKKKLVNGFECYLVCLPIY